MSPDDKQRLYSAIVDVAVLAAVVALGVTHTIGGEAVVGLLGGMVGKRFVAGRAKTQDPGGAA